MSETNEPQMKIIARIHSDFPEKFGIPRQAGLVPELVSKIVFEPEFRDPNALRGIEEWSHLWIIWQFSENIRKDWSPTVRPPRLGGNERVGVFATRSPFRPNPIGLSSVKLEKVVDEGSLGTVLYVSGADIMDGTPIYDIKPYLAYTDSHPDASGSFAAEHFDHSLDVDFPSGLIEKIPRDKHSAVIGMLSNDPRPAFQNDPERVYSLMFAEVEIKFKVDGKKLSVIDVF